MQWGRCTALGDNLKISYWKFFLLPHHQFQQFLLRNRSFRSEFSH